MEASPDPCQLLNGPRRRGSRAVECTGPEGPLLCGCSSLGGVAEWFKAVVLKTTEGSRLPWVRIPPPPPGWIASEQTNRGANHHPLSTPLARALQGLRDNSSAREA